jgi:hypothetical protein
MKSRVAHTPSFVDASPSANPEARGRRHTNQCLRHPRHTNPAMATSSVNFARRLINRTVMKKYRFERKDAAAATPRLNMTR